MTTKEKIETQALDLFSQYGYFGVSVRDIAGRVGIKESSIYKHFKGKKEIFDTITEHYMEKTANIFGEASDHPAFFQGISAEALINMMKSTFQTFASDEYITKCRKLFMISAPGNPEIGNQYAQSFISTPIAFNTSVFTWVIEATKNKKAEAEVMAYQFYSPVFCILQEYDNGIMTMEEALIKIEKITRKFLEVYGI